MPLLENSRIDNLATDLRRDTLQVIVPTLCVGMHKPTLRVVERKAFRYTFHAEHWNEITYCLSPVKYVADNFLAIPVITSHYLITAMTDISTNNSGRARLACTQARAGE